MIFPRPSHVSSRLEPDRDDRHVACRGGTSASLPATRRSPTEEGGATPAPATARFGRGGTRRSRAQRLTALYAIFALISIATNLVAQQIAVTVLAGRVEAVLPLSVLCGTAAGFASKYVLDKNYIFFDASSGRREEARKVALYGFFGLFTTALFWSVEGASLWIFGTTAAKYAGAVVGLVLGYALKFALDRRFTFTGATRRAR